MSAPSPAARPDVSVLVVNYNGLRFLAPLLASLRGAFLRHRAEIVVVDNGSTDGSAAWLRAAPGITLLELGVNTGFTGGNNLAARAARGRVLLLLNNDTEVLAPLDDLVDLALRPEVGAAGCPLVHRGGRVQHSIGLPHTPARILLSWLGAAHWPGVGAAMRRVETDPHAYERAHDDVAWVSGACMATRREVWNAVGGLDARLFMYCDDVDYAARVRRKGWRVAFLPFTGVLHFEAAGRAWVGALALRRTARAYFIVVSTSHGAWAARGVGAGLSAVFAARAGLSALRGCIAPARAQRGLHFEKAHGFACAAAELSRASLTGLAPALA